MTGHERVPAEVWPLAAYLGEEMAARGWTTLDVAMRMGGRGKDEVAFDLLCLDMLMCVHKDGLILGDMPAKLSRAFGISPEYFVDLDAVWRAHPDRRVDYTPPDTLFSAASNYGEATNAQPAGEE